MTETEQRLTAAIAAIHDHLHAGRVNDAHAACECALSGAEVRQPNLTLPQTARAHLFAHRFNELCISLDMTAGFLATTVLTRCPDIGKMRRNALKTRCRTSRLLCFP